MFTQMAARASRVAGSVGIFLASLLACLAWVGWGVWAGWTENVHLLPTSILTWTTWILVVLVQNSQTRHEDALQAKLDELIRATDKADNRLIGAEQPPPRESGAS